MRRLLLAGALLWSGEAVAQTSTGSISGDVADQDGGPLAGVRVVASSPTQIGGDRVVTTDANGHFVFLNLTPGLFEVRASKTGLRPFRQSGIRVSLGGTAELFVILEIPTAREDIVIRVEQPAVDVQSHRVGQSVSAETMQSVPLRSRNFQGVAELTPGVTDSPQAGGNPNVRGGAYFNNTFTVDGISITDPVTHTFGTNFNFDAMSDVEVLTAGYGPEYALTTGGVVNILTKSGSNDFHLDASTYYESSHLTVLRPEERGQVFSETALNLNVSGPILRDRLWYFGSLQWDNRVASIPPDPNGVLPRHPARRFVGPEYLGKLNFQATPRLQLVGVVQGAVASIANTRQLITVEPDAERHQDQYSTAASLEARYSVSPTTLWRTQAAFSRSVLDIYPESGDRTTPGYEADLTTGVATVNDTRLNYDRRLTLQLNTDMTQFVSGLGGEHQLRYGIKAAHAWNPSLDGYPGNVVYQRDNGVDFRRTQYCVEFNPDTLECTPGMLETTTTGQTGLLFLQDGFSPSFYRRLTITPGVGLEVGHAANDAGDTITSFLTATAHLNLTWRPLGDTRTVVRAGYNQYVDMGFLSIPGFVGKGLFSRQCDVDEAARDAGARDPYVRNCLNGGGDAGVTVGYPDGPPRDDEGNALETTNPDPLRPPRTHEVYVGAERELFGGLVLGTDLVWRRYEHLFEDVETNIVWNELGNDAEKFLNGKSEFVWDLETPDEAERTNTSFSVYLKRSGEVWGLLASYTYLRSFGTVNEGFATVFLDNDQQTIFYSGPLSDDVRHTVFATASYEIGKQLRIGPSVRVQSGTPYDRFFLNDLFGSYQDRRAPRGQDPGSLSDPDDNEELREPWTTEVDLLLLYNLKEAFGLNGTMSVAFLNLLNSRTPTRYEDRNLPVGAPTQFGDVIDRQDPFRVRIGMRFEY
ncbi:MAG: TonB-dependent receptor [Deltaproteobacteria bacterium]|nr:TonB-dependent receptor [Deltaproteobacteria bacterium]